MNEDRARAVGAGRVGGRTFMPRTDVPVTIGRLVCWRAGASAAVAPGYNNMMQRRAAPLFCRLRILPSTISDASARLLGCLVCLTCKSAVIFWADRDALDRDI